MLMTSLLSFFPIVFGILIYFDSQRLRKKGIAVNPLLVAIGFVAFCYIVKYLVDFSRTIFDIFNYHSNSPIGVGVYFAVSILLPVLGYIIFCRLHHQAVVPREGVSLASQPQSVNKIARNIFLASIAFSVIVEILSYAGFIYSFTGDITRVVTVLTPPVIGFVVILGIVFWFFNDASRFQKKGAPVNSWIVIAALAGPPLLISYTSSNLAYFLSGLLFKKPLLSAILSRFGINPGPYGFDSPDIVLYLGGGSFVLAIIIYFIFRLRWKRKIAVETQN